MNALVTTFDASVPAFLRNEKFLALNNKLAAGLSSGAPPRISFKAGRYRFIAADGTETLANENGTNGTTLDVIVLDANPAVSKVYYDKKYDPNAEGDDAAPACFSEDGQAPSARALRPQSRSCASCPMNAWGSKISEASGKKIKACSDVKKIAVIPTSNLAGDAFMLGIPGASLKTWSGFVKSCASRGVPIGAMVVRLGFNPNVSYPELTFTPTAWVNEAQMAAIQDLLGSPETATLVGVGDQPHAGPFALEQQHQQNVAISGAVGPIMQAGPTGASTVIPVAPTAPIMAQPVAAAPVQPPQGMPLPQHTVQAMAQAPANPPPVAAEAPAPAPTTRRRGRPPAAPAAAEAAMAPPVSQPIVVPQAAAPVATPVHTVAATPGTDPNMNALLDSIMGGGR